MIKPTRVEILERHPEAEMPYNLVKEIYDTVTYVKGEKQISSTSRLVTKNIRSKGEKEKLTKAELEAKHAKELKETQEYNKKLLEDAEKAADEAEAKKAKEE